MRSRLASAEVALDGALDALGPELLHLLEDGRHTLLLGDVYLHVARVRAAQRDLAEVSVRVERQFPEQTWHISQPRERRHFGVVEGVIARFAFRAHGRNRCRHAVLVDVDLSQGGSGQSVSTERIQTEQTVEGRQYVLMCA